MSATIANNKLQFRNFKQYKDHYAPSSAEQVDYSGKSEEAIWGAEIARKAFDAVKKQMEEEKKKAPWERLSQ